LENDFQRIITHDDFDGVASAAICSYMYDIEKVVFAGPNTMTRSEIAVTDHDIVCDLPYPLTAGLWFDHHTGNLAELQLRGIDSATIPGAFADKPSCCRVVLDYFSRDEKLPDDFEVMAQAADLIDSFGYKSVKEWRQDSAATRIDWAIKAPGTAREKRRFLRDLVFLLRDTSIEEAAREPLVTERVAAYQKQEAWMRKIIQQVSSFLPQDEHREIVILDLTGFRRREKIIKNLALLDYPEALAVLEIQPLYQYGVRSTELSISMSLSLNMNGIEHGKDVGEIMRRLNLGDGHAGAGAGLLQSPNKSEMLKQKQEVLAQIFEIWKSQPMQKKD
jgi:oligoribonuclease NrnB/cAMP/cGMP phosphodiesterase (DHH superfamily)